MSFIAHQYSLRNTWHIYFRIYLFIATRRYQKTKNTLFPFVTGVKPTSWFILRPWSSSLIMNVIFVKTIISYNFLSGKIYKERKTELKLLILILSLERYSFDTYWKFASKSTAPYFSKLFAAQHFNKAYARGKLG